MVSLQFTADHTFSENKMLASLLELEIKNNSNFHFFLKQHPRFNSDIDMSNLLCLPNISMINGEIEDNLLICSLHLTTYSTTVFETSILGIPSRFIETNIDKMDIFNTQYKYPYYNYSLNEIYDNYNVISSDVKKWSKNFLKPFDQFNFLNILKNA